MAVTKRTRHEVQHIPFSKTSRYSIGVIKNRIQAIDERARELIDAEKGSDDGS